MVAQGVYSYGQQYLTENKGQWNDVIKFKKSSKGAIIYLKQSKISVLQYDFDEWAHIIHHPHQEELKLFKFKKEDNVLHQHHYEIEFLNCSPQVFPEGEQVSTYYLNYFIGNDSTKWATNVRDFGIVRYANLYPNIDLVVHGNGNGLKYDFILKPGANLSDIQVKYNYVDQVKLKGNELQIKTSIGTIEESIPMSFILQSDEQKEIEVTYSIANDVIGFASNDIPQTQDQTVIIDPEVVFATYAGNSVDNFGFTATYDKHGNMYAGGNATSPDMDFNPNGRYPTTTGAFQTEFQGGDSFNFNGFPSDAVISKYSSDGSQLLFATYLGGELDDYAHSLVVDNKENLVIMGTTNSEKFPVSSNAYQKKLKGAEDIYVTKLNKNGTTLIGSTYIGGSQSDGLNIAPELKYFYADNYRGEVIINKQDEVFVSTCTRSVDFPVVNGFQSKLKGFQDGAFMMFSEDLSNLKWSTYLGGTDNDALYSVDLDSTNHVFVSGGTSSTDLPFTKGGIGGSYNGGIADGFIARMNLSTYNVDRVAYWGTSTYDQIFALEMDNENFVYVVGHSDGKMPVKGDVFNVPGGSQFISKFDNNLDEVVFSTVFGSGRRLPDITINAFLVAECRQIYVSGWGGITRNRFTGSTFGNTKGLKTTTDAYQKTTDNADFYLLALSKHARHLVYATYFGGFKTEDHVDGGTSRFDKEGIIYQSVCSSCPDNDFTHEINDFPTTKGAYAERNVSPRCSNAAFKIAFGNLNRPPWLDDSLYHVTVLDTIGFNYNVTDPDFDSIFVTLKPEAALQPYMVTYQPKTNAVENWSQYIALSAGCESVGDTLDILVYAIDKGCPLYKDSTATIKIVVHPPPTFAPPKATCLNFEDDNTVVLTWDSISINKYFSHTSLFRIDPNGDTIKLKDFTNWRGGNYTDTDVNSPKTTEYQYFFRTYNICDVPGSLSYMISTTREFETPIESTYLVTATVTDENYVSVTWLKSQERDFKHYVVYRKLNSEDGIFEEYEIIDNINDTVYIDKNVKVNSQSYCYAIVVHDNCSHKSEYTNLACTIVLEGVSTPFQHDIWWNEYSDWPVGVNDYTISRCVDTGYLRPIVTTDFDVRTYRDTVFNYDWGGYWYRVKATENAGGYNAESQSNRIYLIQPPLLHVPNAFTPNKDGLNELWGIVPVFVKEYEVQVYNRWGEKVYDSNDVKTDWDGFYKGKQESNTVYIYKIRFTGWDRSVHHRKGTVTVIK